MRDMDVKRFTEKFPARFAGAVIAVSLVVTTSLIGVVSVFSDGSAGLRGRFPYSVLVTAIAFVATLWKLDDEHIDGVTVLIATGGIAIAIGVLFSLAVEGLAFGIGNPDELVASHLLVYFLAAGVFCTGLGMWSLDHWREFTADLQSDEADDTSDGF